MVAKLSINTDIFHSFSSEEGCRAFNAEYFPQTVILTFILLSVADISNSARFKYLKTDRINNHSFKYPASTVQVVFIDLSFKGSYFGIFFHHFDGVFDEILIQYYINCHSQDILTT